MNITVINGRCVRAGNCIEGAHGNPALLIEAPAENIGSHTTSIAGQDVVVMRKDEFNKLYTCLNAVRVSARFGQLNLAPDMQKRINEILTPIEEAP